MLRPQWRATILLSAMRPYTEVVCCVRLDRRRIGLARSDPYLSCATALPEISSMRGSLSALRAALREALADVPVGLVLFGLPMRRGAGGGGGVGGGGGGAAHRRQRRLLARALARAAPTLFARAGLGCAWDKQLSMREARREQRKSEQWDSIGCPDAGRPWAARGGGVRAERRVGAGVHAAVSLQTFLDEETGGWPNTFG